MRPLHSLRLFCVHSQVKGRTFSIHMMKLRTHEHCQSGIDMIGYVFPVTAMRMLEMALNSPEASSRLNMGARLIDWLPFPPHVELFGHKRLRSLR